MAVLLAMWKMLDSQRRKQETETGTSRTQETYTEHEPEKARNLYPRREVETERSSEMSNIKRECTQRDNGQGE